MNYIKTYEQHNEGIRSNLAKAGLVGSLLMTSPEATANKVDTLQKQIGTEYTQTDSIDKVYNNVKEMSEERKGRLQDEKLSQILSEIESNLQSKDPAKFIELYTSLSKHIETEYGYKIGDKKIEDLTEETITELKNGTNNITLFSILGWLGSICLAVCGIPQAWLSYKEKNSRGISWAFVLLWAFGEIFALAYVYDRLDLPLLLNYSANILILAVIIYYKINPKDKISLEHDKEV